MGAAAGPCDEDEDDEEDEDEGKEEDEEEGDEDEDGATTASSTHSIMVRDVDRTTFWAESP